MISIFHQGISSTYSMVSFAAYISVVTQRSYPVGEEKRCATTQMTAMKEVKEDWKPVHIFSLHGHSKVLSNNLALNLSSYAVHL